MPCAINRYRRYHRYHRYRRYRRYRRYLSSRPISHSVNGEIFFIYYFQFIVIILTMILHP